MKFENSNKKLVDRIHSHPKIRAARSSARTYASTIRRVGEQFGGGYKDNLQFLNKPELLEKIKKHDSSLSVKRNLVNAVICGLKLNPNEKLAEKYHKYLLELNRQVDEHNKSGKLTKKQSEKMIPWARIVKLQKHLAKSIRLSQVYKQKSVGARDLRSINQYVALSCYVLTPPVRLDWASVTFHNKKGFANIKEKTGNYLVVTRNTVTVYWNAYKTFRHHGPLSNVLPKDLSRILRRHVRFMKIVFPNNERLFLNSRFEPLTRQNLGKLLETLFNNFFKKRISVSALRRIYLSSKYSHSVIREARKDAELMHHTVSEAQNSYIKTKDGK